jgi:hypothetical protein
MSNNIEVFRQTLGLLDTLDEGLAHAKSLFVEVNSEEAIEILYNVLAGVESIINALKPCAEKFIANNLQGIEACMLDKFNILINLLSSNNIEAIADFLNKGLVPAFTNWKNEITILLAPYILS